MEPEKPQEQIKADLLDNNIDLEDMGFKIKKKKKLQKEGDSSLSSRQILNTRTETETLKFLKVDEMNVIKVYNDIIDKASNQDNFFMVGRSILAIGNKQIVRSSN